jgi:hypothetical protein
MRMCDSLQPANKWDFSMDLDRHGIFNVIMKPDSLDSPPGSLLRVTALSKCHLEAFPCCVDDDVIAIVTVSIDYVD